MSLTLTVLKCFYYFLGRLSHKKWVSSMKTLRAFIENLGVSDERDEISHTEKKEITFYTANQDVNALTEKLTSILPITHFKLKLETSALHF